MIGENRFDFVLGSLHKTRKYGDMMMLNYAHPALDLQDVFRTYYEELLEVVQWGHFDSLAHLGYPLRYLKPYHRTVDLEKIDDVFAEIMKGLVSQGKALELNTGGLRMEIEAFTPVQQVPEDVQGLRRRDDYHRFGCRVLQRHRLRHPGRHGTAQERGIQILHFLQEA
ncbi:MAG: PHP domain-containing protein [Acutalibacteraceae bacterium]